MRSPTDVVVAGVLPVTDTVKDVVERDGVTLVAQTHDRDRLPAAGLAARAARPSVVAALDDWPDDDLRPRVARPPRRAGRCCSLEAPPSAAAGLARPTTCVRLEALTPRVRRLGATTKSSATVSLRLPASDSTATTATSA